MAIENTVQEDEAKYSQLSRTGKVYETEYMASFLMLRQQLLRHYKNDGKPYDACLYKMMVCELVQLDEGWDEYGASWQHYHFTDETETVKVTMLEGQAKEGLGWYQIRVRYVNNPLNVRGEIVGPIES